MPGSRPRSQRMRLVIKLPLSSCSEKCFPVGRRPLKTMPMGCSPPMRSAMVWRPRGVPSESFTLEGGLSEVETGKARTRTPARKSCSVWVEMRTRRSRSAGLMPSVWQVLLTDSQISSIVNTRNNVVGIVGATGAVGQELVRLLHERNFPMSQLRLFASARSAGKTVTHSGQHLRDRGGKGRGVCRPWTWRFSRRAARSRGRWAADAIASGCTVIDKSSAYRQQADVPLVVPEINPEGLRTHKGLIANPNCSTAGDVDGPVAAASGVWAEAYFCVHVPICLRPRARKR